MYGSTFPEKGKRKSQYQSNLTEWNKNVALEIYFLLVKAKIMKKNLADI